MKLAFRNTLLALQLRFSTWSHVESGSWVAVQGFIETIRAGLDVHHHCHGPTTKPFGQNRLIVWLTGTDRLTAPPLEASESRLRGVYRIIKIFAVVPPSLIVDWPDGRAGCSQFPSMR